MSDNEIILYEQKSLVESTDLKEKFDQIEHDLENVKDNLIDVSNKLSNQLDDIIDFAKSAPHPKTYEALAKVVVAISTLNRDAANVIVQKKNLLDSINKNNVEDNETSQTLTYNDNRQVTFNGTATDLLDSILGKKDV